MGHIQRKHLKNYTPFVPSLARTPESAIRKARAHVHRAEADRLDAAVPSDERIRRLEELPVWSRAEVRKRHGEWVLERDIRRRRVLLLLEGCVVDAGSYLDDHVCRIFSNFSGKPVND